MTFIKLHETQPGYYIFAPHFPQQEAEAIQARAIPPGKVRDAPNLSHLTFMPSMHWSTSINLNLAPTLQKADRQIDIGCSLSGKDPSCTLIGVCSLVTDRGAKGYKLSCQWHSNWQSNWPSPSCSLILCTDGHIHGRWAHKGFERGKREMQPCPLSSITLLSFRTSI